MMGNTSISSTRLGLLDAIGWAGGYELKKEYQMRRTKIVCTIGPATNSEERLEALMRAGMNVARFPHA